MTSSASSLYFSVDSTERIVEKPSGKTFDVYLIKVSGPNKFSKICKKRFSEFKDFEKTWRPLYPNLDCELPPDRWFKSGKDVITERKIGLSVYLNKAVMVKALHAYLATFLGIDKSIITNAPVASVGPASLQVQEITRVPAFGNKSNVLSSISELKSEQQIFAKLQCFCVAEYDYAANSENELSIRAGEKFALLDGSDADWWFVRNGAGAQGYIPATYCSKK